MRHFALYIGLAAGIVASCSTKENDFVAPAQEDEVFYASFEKPAEDDTRVYVNEDFLLRWTTDDRVSIFNKITYNQEYRFIGQTGDYEGGFNKVDNPEFMTGSEIPHVISVYPFRRQTRVSENEVVTVSLPAEQTSAQNSFGLGDNTMVSVSSGNLLQYKSVGGFLVINLYGKNVTIESIMLKGNNGEKLAGDAMVTMPLNGVPTAVMADNATTEITLTCDTPVKLSETPEESTQFWFVVPPITFSKGFTITVREYTGEVIEKSTDKSITIGRNKLSKMSPLEMEGHTIPVPEAVDLGLPSGVKWASFNLGASKLEEYGDYYAWGETEPYYSSLDPLTWKEGKPYGYDWRSYKWCMEDHQKMIKYCNHSFFGFNGFTDNKTVLDLEDDAAHVNLGGTWRMPTDAEWTELRENCTWERTSLNGINGQKVTGPNGNSIFLPATGIYEGTRRYFAASSGFYRSSSLLRSDPTIAPYVYSDYDFNTLILDIVHGREYGLSIRPVLSEFISVESVSLNKTSLTLFKGSSEQLTLSISPTNATVKTVTWTSSNPSVADAFDGIVDAKSAGTTTITAWASDGVHHAICDVTVREQVSVPEAVDLGLSIKWASFNLGASKPEEYGDYYAWGETEPYYSNQDPLTWKEGKEAGFEWPSYKWCMGSERTLTKYCTVSSYGYNGFTDNKTVLDLEDDAAYVNLGDSWRMPTDDEWTELRTQCSWIWTTLNGVNGYKVIGPTGNSIFLSATGVRFGTYSTDEGFDGEYWSSSLLTEYPIGAWDVSFISEVVNREKYIRISGRAIRPVYDPNNKVSISVEASAELLYDNGDSVRIDPIRYEGFHREYLTDNDLEDIFVDLTKNTSPDFTSAVLYLAVYDVVSGGLFRNESYGVVYNTHTGHYDFASL